MDFKIGDIRYWRIDCKLPSYITCVRGKAFSVKKIQNNCITVTYVVDFNNNSMIYCFAEEIEQYSYPINKCGYTGR